MDIHPATKIAFTRCLHRVNSSEQPPLGNQEVVITNGQQNQAALFVCQEMNSGKNLRLEIALLKASIEEIKTSSCQDARGKASSKKLPKVLSVSSVIDSIVFNIYAI